MQVHQLVPALHDGDAIGDSARAMRDFLRRGGLTSDIYAYDIDEAISHEALPFRSIKPQLSTFDILILHYALPSGMSEFLKNADSRKAIIYHNITPAYFWLNYDPSLVHLAEAGRRDLHGLSRFIDRSAGDSEYNRQELEKFGFKNTCVLPIYINQERYSVRPSPWIKSEPEFMNFLSVGRVAPNKKLEDVIRLYFFYKKLYSIQARLVFAGKTNVSPAYYAALKELISRYGLLHEEVVFAGHVTWADLVAYYKSADVFVSMSEHEGFCVPLIEAMICETPIVAYSSTAIPHVLGSAGIQFKDKNYPEIAAICHRVKHNAVFRDEVMRGQKERLKEFSSEKVERAIEEFLAPLL